MGPEIRRYIKSIVDSMTLPRSNNPSFVWYTALKYHYGCTHTRSSVPSSGPFEAQFRIVCCDLDLCYFIKALSDWDDIVFNFIQVKKCKSGEFDLILNNFSKYTCNEVKPLLFGTHRVCPKLWAVGFYHWNKQANQSENITFWLR